MLLPNQVNASLLGLPTLGAPFTVAGFTFAGVLALFALAVSLSRSPYQQRIDRSLFWIFGLVLVAFAVLRPVGLARDDLNYVEIIKSLCSTPDCGQGIQVTRDYFWYYLVKFGLPYRPGSLRVALALSGVGVLIKLFVIDRLCRERLLALLLFIPLCYVQYDLTQLRAGLAISWMMLGIYWLVKSKTVLGSATLLTNALVHSQAVFSPGLLTYKVFGLSRAVLPVLVLLLLGLIHTGLYPNGTFLVWLGTINETSPYYAGFKVGEFSGIKIFPYGYYLILAYGIWLCYTLPHEHNKLGQIVSAGVLLATFLAWFFAIVVTMQMRLFEFYVVPILFLGGNAGASKLKILATCFLALILYLRLELLNDWILG